MHSVRGPVKSFDFLLETCVFHFFSGSQIIVIISYMYRKRAAEQMIKSYFFQLTDGCGLEGCSNEYCASSGRKQTSKDDAAALALQLFMKKARLCEPLLQERNHKGTLPEYHCIL